MTNDEPRLLGDYITRREHGSYPVGSKCVVYRKPNDILLLKMEDGGEVELDGRASTARGSHHPHREETSWISSVTKRMLGSSLCSTRRLSSRSDHVP